MLNGIALSGCSGALWQPDTRPGSQKTPRIGFLTPTAGGGLGLESFREGLRDHGYIEGASIQVEFRGGPEVLQHAIELAELPVDVIVTSGIDGIKAMQDRSSNMPIITLAGSDAIQAGLVISLGHPGGNVTGLSAVSDQLSGRRLALLREAAPGITRVGAIWDPDASAKADEWRETERAAQTLGLEAISLPVRGRDDLAGAFESARAARINALVSFQDQVTVLLRDQITEFALASGYPSVFEFDAWTSAGGLMSYGPNRAAMSYRAADYVDRVLKGAKPADMPLEQPTVFDLIINLKTARALGLTIPASVLSQATDVIQ